MIMSLLNLVGMRIGLNIEGTGKHDTLNQTIHITSRGESEQAIKVSNINQMDKTTSGPLL